MTHVSGSGGIPRNRRPQSVVIDRPIARTFPVGYYFYNGEIFQPTSDLSSDNLYFYDGKDFIPVRGLPVDQIIESAGRDSKVFDQLYITRPVKIVNDPNYVYKPGDENYIVIRSSDHVDINFNDLFISVRSAIDDANKVSDKLVDDALARVNETIRQIEKDARESVQRTVDHLASISDTSNFGYQFGIQPPQVPGSSSPFTNPGSALTFPVLPQGQGGVGYGQINTSGAQTPQVLVIPGHYEGGHWVPAQTIYTTQGW